MLQRTAKRKPNLKAPRRRTKSWSDEDLFGNTDNIFGDLPAAVKTKSPKTKKKKKKKKKVEQSTTATAIKSS